MADATCAVTLNVAHGPDRPANGEMMMIYRLVKGDNGVNEVFPIHDRGVPLTALGTVVTLEQDVEYVFSSSITGRVHRKTPATSTAFFGPHGADPVLIDYTPIAPSPGILGDALVSGLVDNPGSDTRAAIIALAADPVGVSDEFMADKAADAGSLFRGALDGEFAGVADVYDKTAADSKYATITNLAAKVGGQVTTTALGPNIQLGSTGSANIASDVSTASLLNPGSAAYNNVIGGTDPSTVNTLTPNVAATGSGANVSLVGGYDNMACDLSSKIISDHSYTQGTGGHNAIFGGAINKIRGVAAKFSVIAGGQENDIQSQYSFATGYLNTITGGGSARVSGDHNTVTATGGTADGTTNVVSAIYARAQGTTNLAAGNYSVAEGANCAARFVSQQVFSGGKFAAQGDAQVSQMEMHRATTDATTVTMGVVGSSSSYQLQPNQSATFESNIVARVVGGTDTAAWKISGCYRRGATGTPTAVGTPVVTPIGADTGAATWAVAVSADSAGGINIRVTGEAAKTIRWVQRFETVEVAV